MLVIGRRPGDAVVIGTGAEQIEIEVLESSPSQVKLGIRAPRSIPIIRKEIFLVGEANQAASRPMTDTGLNNLLQKLSTFSPTSR